MAPQRLKRTVILPLRTPGLQFCVDPTGTVATHAPESLEELAASQFTLPQSCVPLMQACDPKIAGLHPETPPH
jgi:hypothetical protein